MSDVKANKTYIIRNKETKELFRAASGKTSWKAPGHAKNAFNQTVAYGRSAERYGLKVIVEEKRWGTDIHGPKFSEQDVYEVVELKPESEDTLARAVDILKQVSGRCDSVAFDMIYDFLEEIGENE